MKKTIAILIAAALLLSSFSVFSLDINLAYYDFKTAHPEFVKSLTDEGITESQIITFVYDLYEYLKQADTVSPVTEENFEKFAVEAIFEVSSQEAHYPLQDALLILYPDAIKLAVTQNKVHEDFKPLVATIKKIIFSSDEFGNKNQNGNNTLPLLPDSKPQNDITFTDINSSHWAYDAIRKLSENFILNGYLDATFKPENNITRAEFAKIIVSAADAYDHSAASSFTDVSKDAWYYNYVSTAYKLGYITGYPDGSFHPEDNITRADICTIVGRATGNAITPPESTISFSDTAQIPPYALQSVIALTDKGILNGFSDGSFRPLSFATRAQTAQIIYNAFFKN